MFWKITTSPAVEPVSLTDIKLHLRVTSTADNDLITSLIQAARQWCEDYENRAYITQTITAKMDRFCNEIEIPKPRLQSVTSIKYIDVDGTEQTLDSSYYDVDIYSEPGRITLAYNQSWPGIRGDINGIEIIYVAGYGDAATDVPAKTVAAIKLLVAHLYENREASLVGVAASELPMGVESLLNSRVNLI